MPKARSGGPSSGSNVKALVSSWTPATPEISRRFPRLETLDLTGTRTLPDAIPRLAELTQLRNLALSGPDVGDAALAELTALRSLELPRRVATPLTVAGMTHLPAFQH